MADVKYYPHFDRIVKIKSGLIRGAAGADPKFTVYKGIPYAKPPVDELRWRSPRPVAPWDGVRDCVEFGSICCQDLHEVDSLYGKEFFQHEETRSEDCLYLNVWTPSMGGNEKMPVLFWVHGGGLSAGYGTEPEFDGEAFCREGVILVTFNYRLGILGFYANSELAKESGHGVAGNYGHLDQIFALKWVRENIAAFGGDPDRITIFGQSAGAASVQAMCASPSTEGDIAGCIIMSSASVSRPGEAGGLMPGVPYEEALKMGDAFLQEAGCGSTAELRKMSFEQLKSLPGLQMDFAKGIFPKYRFSTLVDGCMLLKNGSEMIYTGEMHDIPFMVGNTLGEGKMFGSRARDLDGWKAQMRAQYGEEFLEKFPVSSMDEAKALSDQLHGMMISNRAFCECLLKNNKKPAYLYLFDRELPGSNDGSFHSSELWYVFGTVGRCWRPMTGVDFDLSRTMTKAWANFARCANPNGAGVPEWVAYTADSRCNMHFAPESKCEPISEPAVLKYLVEQKVK